LITHLPDLNEWRVKAALYLNGRYLPEELITTQHCQRVWTLWVKPDGELADFDDPDPIRGGFQPVAFIKQDDFAEDGRLVYKATTKGKQQWIGS
jgi:hypothetical protein